VFRPQFGLPFVGPDGLARFGGLVHRWLRSSQRRTFLADGLIYGHRLRGLAPPLDRNDRAPPPSTPATAKPPFEVEGLDRGAQSGSHQGLRRQQRDMMAGGASAVGKPIRG
jgi:hypothetical protein